MFCTDEGYLVSSSRQALWEGLEPEPFEAQSELGRCLYPREVSRGPPSLGLRRRPQPLPPGSVRADHVFGLELDADRGSLTLFLHTEGERRCNGKCSYDCAMFGRSCPNRGRVRLGFVVCAAATLKDCQRVGGSDATYRYRPGRPVERAMRPLFSTRSLGSTPTGPSIACGSDQEAASF